MSGTWIQNKNGGSTYFVSGQNAWVPNPQNGGSTYVPPKGGVWVPNARNPCSTYIPRTPKK
jgi:hypothetical protein